MYGIAPSVQSVRNATCTSRKTNMPIIARGREQIAALGANIRSATTAASSTHVANMVSKSGTMSTGVGSVN